MKKKKKKVRNRVTDLHTTEKKKIAVLLKFSRYIRYIRYKIRNINYLKMDTVLVLMPSMEKLIWLTMTDQRTLALFFFQK